MKRIYIYFTLVFILLVVFSACRKEIKVKLPEYEQKLVVEASIETDGYATVLLSYSVPFFENYDFTNPIQAFVKGAKVVVSDGVVYDTLVELDPGAGYIYVGTKLKGQTGKTYYLSIYDNGKTYSADTYIGSPVALDSIYFKGEKDSLGFMWAHLTEPAGPGNHYRWFAKRYPKDLFFAAPFASVFDDKFVDGKDFHFAFERGAQPNAIQENKDDPERGFYKRGDTVVVKFCTIGKKEFDFWNSYYLNKSSNGNPFSAPTNIKSFINGDPALGGFFGYSSSFDTLVIPK